MAERNPSVDGFALIDQGLAEFLDWFGQTKRVWQLEEMVRDLIPPDVGASEAGDDFVDAIITRLATTPVGVSALHVMGKVAVPLVALRARSTVERIIEQGGPKPSSLARRPQQNPIQPLTCRIVLLLLGAMNCQSVKINGLVKTLVV